MNACPEGSKGGGGVLTSARLAGSQEGRGPDVSSLVIQKAALYKRIGARAQTQATRFKRINLTFLKKEELQLSEASDTKKGPPLAVGNLTLFLVCVPFFLHLLIS